MPITVYWLKHLSGEDYVGSTEVGTSQRWKKYKSEIKSRKLIRFLDEHNYEGFTMITLQVASGYTKPERWIMEQYWIDKMRPSLNEINAYTTKEQHRVCRITSQLNSTYLETCGCGCQFQHCERARHERTSKHKRYLAGYVEPLRTGRARFVVCACGQRHRRGDKAQHQRSDRHKRRMAALEK